MRTEQGVLLLLQGSLCEGSSRLSRASSQLQQPHHSPISQPLQYAASRIPVQDLPHGVNEDQPESLS